jgi:hypothetical protein
MKLLAAFMFFLGIILSLVGIFPYRDAIRLNVPDEIKDSIRFATWWKYGWIVGTVIFIVLGLASAFIAVILGTSPPSTIARVSSAGPTRHQDSHGQWTSILSSLGDHSYSDVTAKVHDALGGSSTAELKAVGEKTGVVVSGSKKSMLQAFVRHAHELKALDDQNKRPPFTA